jgi:hypothetical protein
MIMNKNWHINDAHAHPCSVFTYKVAKSKQQKIIKIIDISHCNTFV